MEHNYS